MSRHEPFLRRRDLLKGMAAVAVLPAFSGLACAAGGRNTLILFYSRSGNTRSLARRIHARLGGDLAEVAAVTPYPEKYDICTEQAKKELADGIFPPIAPLDVDLDRYDIILPGSPNWWSTWSGPMRTLLRDHDFAGKTLCPFNTHGGGGWQNMLTDLKKCCPKARILDGLSIRGNSVGQADARIDGWLRKAGLLA